MQAVLDAPALGVVLRVITLALSTLVVVVGLFGPPATSRNLAPWAPYVTFWVGLLLASLLLGPVWHV